MYVISLCCLFVAMDDHLPLKTAPAGGKRKSFELASRANASLVYSLILSSISSPKETMSYRTSACPSFHPSVRPSVHPSLHQCSIRLSIHPYVRPSIHTSVLAPACLFSVGCQPGNCPKTRGFFEQGHISSQLEAHPLPTCFNLHPHVSQLALRPFCWFRSPPSCL